MMVFAGALGTSVSVIGTMIAPQWRRIGNLAMGRIEPSFSPLAQLASAERRIAVRRWSAASPAQSISRLRAAA
jgi:hypothetical protein